MIASGHDVSVRLANASGGPSDPWEIRMYELDEHEAFRVMSMFISRFAEQAGDDLLTLMSDITIRPDGGTFDPAAWSDWMSCVETVKSAG